ncbi:BTB/POZ domain-containing protein 17-like [Tigriopus californicus]|nr:BTB/POZ domain-containing protein 17-like [Tigriopus californicus]
MASAREASSRPGPSSSASCSSCSPPSSRSCSSFMEGSSKPEVDNSSTVIQKIAEIYAKRLMSDVMLVVGNVEYPSHRLILCASSDVFQVMLMDPSWSEHSETRITLCETPSCEAVFEDFLRYLYTGKIQFDYATVIPVVSLADKYNVRDLLRVGLDFMSRNVATACKRHQVVSWYQFASAAGHTHIAGLCREFILANFTRVTETVDFGHFELDHLVDLLQCHTMVVKDEISLFHHIMRWIDMQREMMVQSGEENIDIHIGRLISAVLPHIRYPMMTPAELVKLLLFPMSKSLTESLVEEIRTALNFHTQQLPEITPAIQRTCEKYSPVKFTPRLYTTEKYCASLCIDHYHNLSTYDCRSLLFSSHAHVAEHLGEEQSEWVVDIYPKGVWFQRCVTVYQPTGLEVPGRVLKTVRVSIWTRNEEEQRVKIGILLIGEQDGFQHVRRVISRNFVFSANNQIVNFDDILDFDELNDLKNRSHFLCGSKRNALRVMYVITPLSPLSSLD